MSWYIVLMYFNRRAYIGNANWCHMFETSNVLSRFKIKILYFEVVLCKAIIIMVYFK